MRWIFSHTLRHKLVILGLFAGALGNAVMASVMPLFVGRAFDAVIETPPDLRGLAVASVVVAVSQLVRGVQRDPQPEVGEGCPRRVVRQPAG